MFSALFIIKSFDWINFYVQHLSWMFILQWPKDAQGACFMFSNNSIIEHCIQCPDSVMFLIGYSDSFNILVSCSQRHFNHTSCLFISIEAFECKQHKSQCFTMYFLNFSENYLFYFYNLNKTLKWKKNLIHAFLYTTKIWKLPCCDVWLCTAGDSLTENDLVLLIQQLPLVWGSVVTQYYITLQNPFFFAQILP